MRAFIFLSTVAPMLLLGCSSSDASTATDATVTDSSAADGKATDAPVDTTPLPNTCLLAGGQCGCAGGCPAGMHHGSGTDDNACPQPCDGCGACSEWCCLPDVPATDAGADGG
jgi:hypothetical protein